VKFLEFLTELRKRFVHRSVGTASGLYANKNSATLPTTVFVSRDGRSLKQSENIIAIKIQPKNMSIMKNALLRKKHITRDETPSDAAQLMLINKLHQLDLDGDISIANLANNLPVTINELSGRARIYKYVTTDLGLPVMIYDAVFGERPEEMGEGDFTPFHNARLFVPDNMRKKNYDAAIITLETVYKHLDQSGEIDVFGGDIRFIPMPSRVGGEYDTEHQTITINQSIAKADVSKVFSLLHEYGHKKMYESLSDEARKAVKKKFIELRRDGHTYGEDIDYASAVLDAISQFEVGQNLTYVGRQKGYKQNPDYVITDIFKDPRKKDILAKLANTDNPTFVRVDYPLRALLNPKRWKTEGMDLTPPERKPKSDIKSDDWFPTMYSETDYDEWWAELYAIYTIGNLHGEPEQWMKSMLHGNTNETVGGNEGEVTSDDPYPLPEPQRGNEEGKPEWEWTDPYHSSGSENAVRSNTP
jgi:hypothetical protein